MNYANIVEIVASVVLVIKIYDILSFLYHANIMRLCYWDENDQNNLGKKEKKTIITETC